MLPASLLSLAAFVVINLAAASTGGIFKPGHWYQGLAKPPWTPPNWAFPVTWSILFILNAVSGWLVWQAAGTAAALPLAVYGASLVINALWSALFFGLRRMDWALVDVGLLWTSIVCVIALFAPVSLVAAALQLPYLAWVTVAGLLNLRMLQLNGRLASA